MSEDDRISLYIATPCYGCMMGMHFLMSLLRLHSECALRGIECGVDFVGQESLITRARCVLAARFLKSKATHFLFLDADIGFQPEAVMRLLASGKDIATAVYPRKSYNWSMVADKARNNPKNEPLSMAGLEYNINLADKTASVENGFVKVLDAATGFMMIKRHVLEKMAKEYDNSLRCVNDLPGDRDDPLYPTEYVALFDCMIDPETRRYLSEDYAFVRRAQKIGFEVWSDLGSTLCHTGTFQYEGDIRQRFKLTYTG